MSKKMSDLCQVPAVLVKVKFGTAEWLLEDGTRIASGGTSHFKRYDVLEDHALGTTFIAWTRATTAALKDGGFDPNNLSIPGLLSVSHGMNLVVGWVEDYTDPASQLLAVVETMDE